MMQKEPGF